MNIFDFIFSAHVKAVKAENGRLREIFNSCDWFWDPEDRECSIDGPWDILDNVRYGDVIELERGGVVEVSYHARLPAAADSGSDAYWECDCKTRVEAKAKVAAERQRRLFLEVNARHD